jgi:hypothetical protein
MRYICEILGLAFRACQPDGSRKVSGAVSVARINYTRGLRGGV